MQSVKYILLYLIALDEFLLTSQMLLGHPSAVFFLFFQVIKVLCINK